MAARGSDWHRSPVSRSGAGLLHRGEFEAQARELILTASLRDGEGLIGSSRRGARCGDRNRVVS